MAFNLFEKRGEKKKKMHILEQAKSLLDFNQKLDISLLDGVVNMMYNEHGDSVKKFLFLSNLSIYYSYRFVLLLI